MIKGRGNIREEEKIKIYQWSVEGGRDEEKLGLSEVSSGITQF